MVIIERSFAQLHRNITLINHLILPRQTTSGANKIVGPGFINETWANVKEPGVYRGQCTELCGKDHGFMPVVVRVVPKAEFQQWYAAQLEASATEALAMAN